MENSVPSSLDNLYSGLDAWRISEKDYSPSNDEIDNLKFFLRFAILAPSSHNSQPWIFKIPQKNRIELYVDRTRALPIEDPGDRLMTISCGAALCNLQLTLEYFGYNYETKLVPNGENDDLVAQIHINKKLETRNSIDGNLKKLFTSITKRRTNRSGYENKPIPDSIVSQIDKIVTNNTSDVWVHVVKDKLEKNTLADLIEKGEQTRWSNKKFRQELAPWIGSNRNTSMDGLPAHSVGLNNALSFMIPFFIRTFNLGKMEGAKNRKLVIRSPMLLIIGTNSDNPKDWLNVGICLEYILLATISENIWCTFVNQPTEIPELRKHLAELIHQNNKYPQIMLRVGYSKKDVKPTPRRPLDQVLH